MIYKRHFYGDQTQGQRDYQEDVYGFYQPDAEDQHEESLLVLLADGMGGVAGGRQASSLVVDSFLVQFGAATGTIPQRLIAALEAANQQLTMAVEERVELSGMGCTLVAAVCSASAIYWLSVGDSILLLLRGDQIIRLNADHSLGATLDEQAQRGEITVEEALATEGRNQLRSALTGKAITLIDLAETPMIWQKGDRLLLASDGLLTLSWSEITTTMKKSFWSYPSAETLVKRLLDAVAQRGEPYQDNTTVIVVKL